jgi:hypothetical protein
MPESKKPEAELEDLDVREVSVVDRPAIQRRFLIVKSDNPTEETMGTTRKALPAEEARELQRKQEAAAGQPPTESDDFLDLLGIAEVPAPDQDKPAEQEEIQKMQSGEALRMATAALQSIMSVVETAKKAGDKPLDEKQAAAIKQAVGQIDVLASKIAGGTKQEGEEEDEKDEEGKAKQEGKGEDEDKEEAEKSALAKLTTGLERMMAMVSRLKEMQADEDVPEKEGKELKAISGMLGSLLAKKEEPEKEDDPEDKKEPEDKKKAADPAAPLFDWQVFKTAGEDTADPEIVIVDKAGAKMKRTRLSEFKKAVNTLSSILKELEGSVEKNDTRGHDPQLIEAIGKLQIGFDQFKKDMQGSVDDLGKRVQKMETVRPTGNDGDPPKPVEKGDDDKFWAGILD